MIKIGVSSYSFSRLVREGKMATHDIPGQAADMGFDFLEFSTIALPEDESLPGYAEKLRAACEKAGIEARNYTIGADFINGSGGDLAVEIKRVQGEVDIAVLLGVTGMRHDATRGFADTHVGARGFDNALARLADGCRAVTEYAAGKNIRTMVENHGYFCQDSVRVEKLVNAVDHSNFGLLIDMGNFLCADDDPGKAFGLLMPYAFHCHAKDFHVKPGTVPDPGEGWFLSRGGNYLRGAIIGHGDVPVVQCLKIMKAAGYQGGLSIEFEGMEETLRGIGLGLENLRRYCERVFG